MQPKTIKIDNIEYVRSDSVSVVSTKKQIVVLQRGWVVVGDVEKDEIETKINNVYIIRVWGTVEGLGELAEYGPTNKTILDKAPPITVNTMSVVLFMNTNEDNWNV